MYTKKKERLPWGRVSRSRDNVTNPTSDSGPPTVGWWARRFYEPRRCGDDADENESKRVAFSEWDMNRIYF